MNVTAHLADQWRRLSDRRPWLRWVEQWGISVASLALGLLTLLVFRRGLPHVGLIVGYLLLLWLIFVIFTELRSPLEARGQRFVLSAVDYTIQTLYHNLLLFVLPAYYASTTFSSLNAWFVLAVVAGALVTAVDPWYRAVVHPRRWLTHALLAFSMFATLNVALPLVGIPPGVALPASALLSALALTPTFRKGGAISWAGAGRRAGLFAILAVFSLWWLRSAIPPAPLQLARATIARAVENLEPVDPVSGMVSAQVMREWGGLVAYTAVYAPAGLKQPIAHVWRKNGIPVTTIPLSPIRGGRAEGFRTYSRKSDFMANPEGRWTVDVVTASNQLIGRVRFTITP